MGSTERNPFTNFVRCDSPAATSVRVAEGALRCPGAGMSKGQSMTIFARIWDFWQEVVIENISRFCLLAIILLAFIEVIRRYLFGSTFIWYQDVAVYVHMGIIFLYLGVALRNHAHIRLTLILEVLRRKGGRYLRWAECIELIASAIGLVICIVFIWCGIEFVKVGYDFGRTTESADLIIWPFYLILEIGFVFLAIETAIAFRTHLKNLKR